VIGVSFQLYYSPALIKLKQSQAHQTSQVNVQRYYSPLVHQAKVIAYAHQTKASPFLPFRLITVSVEL
jgi:hypothetical protein